MALKRIRERLGRTSGPADDALDAQIPRDDPQVRLMLAQTEAAAIDRDADPVRYARARTEMAKALYEMRRRGWADSDAQAAPILDEAIDILERHRPESRADLAEAHYVAADMRRGRDWETAREHYEAGLRVARRDSDPTLWAALNEGLAATLVRGPSGDEPEIQERSVGLYQEALTIEPPYVSRGHWATTAHGFALTLAERHRGTVIQNWSAILEIMGRAIEPAFEEADGAVQDGVFEMYARALVATGVFGLLQGGVPDDVVLQNVRMGAEGLDTRRSSEDALTPWADKLAALVRESEAGHEAMRPALDIGLVLIEAIEDRRALVLAHALRARWPDAEGGPAHLAEAERLLSPKDDESLQRAVEHARAIRRGAAQTAPAATGDAAPDRGAHEPLPYDDDELQHVLVFSEVQELLSAAAVDGLAVERALDVGRAALAAVRTPAARWAGLMAVGLLWKDRTVGDRRSNLEEALKCLESALELRDATGADRAMLLHNLGLVYKQRLAGVRAENLETAIRHLEAALECQARDDERGGWATTASQLANTYTERVLGDRADNIERALELYEQALERRPRADVPVRWAITKHNLGATLQERRLGNHRRNLEAALAHLHEALAVRTEAALPEHFAMTQDVVADCRVALANSDPERALEHLAEAAAALDASARVWTLDRHRQQWLNNRLRLVDVHIARGQAGGADDDAQAIDIVERVLDAASPETEPSQVAIAHDRLARLLARSGRAEDLARAIAVRQELVEQFAAAGDIAAVSAEAAELGRLLADADRWHEAADAFERALAAEADVSQAAVTLTTRWARMRSVAGLHTDAAFAFGHPSLGRWPEALATLERGRTRVLGDTFERDHRRLDALERLGAEAVAARGELLDAARAMSELATAEVRAGGLAGQAPTAAVREDARRARDRLVAAKATIQRFPGFESFLEPPGIEAVLEAARFGGPLVHLWATKHGGLAVVSADDRSGVARCVATPLLLRSTDVDDALFPRHDSGWPGLLLAQREGGHVLDLALEEVLPWVGQTIATPLSRLLAHIGAERALLVPCGRLGALPMLAAPFAAPGSDCLLDALPVELTPSASVAVAVGEARRPAGGRRYAAIADTQPEAAPLRWAAPEVLAVARAAGADEPLVGAAATRARAVEAMRGADVVHLACHGVYEHLAPERSRLVLADGDLAVTDMLSDRLLDGVRLVIASACETGAADITRLPDEATGLPAALLQAGASHVLGTLWPVSDLSSGLLASRVAAACLDPVADPPIELAAAQRWLRDVGREEALAAARLLVAGAGDRVTPELEDDLAWLELAAPERPFRAPRHWAPFVIFGAGSRARDSGTAG